jgi:hypothetical protein
LSIKGRSLKVGGTFAIIRVNNFDHEKLSQGDEKFEEFQRIHSSMRGYRGSIVVDAGDGRLVTINLWQSQEHAMHAMEALLPELQRLIEPMLSGPSQLVGVGVIIASDLEQRKI